MNLIYRRFIFRNSSIMSIGGRRPIRSSVFTYTSIAGFQGDTLVITPTSTEIPPIVPIVYTDAAGFQGDLLIIAPTTI